MSALFWVIINQVILGRGFILVKLSDLRDSVQRTLELFLKWRFLSHFPVSQKIMRVLLLEGIRKTSTYGFLLFLPALFANNPANLAPFLDILGLPNFLLLGYNILQTPFLPPLVNMQTNNPIIPKPIILQFNLTPHNILLLGSFIESTLNLNSLSLIPMRSHFIIIGSKRWCILMWNGFTILLRWYI